MFLYVFTTSPLLIFMTDFAFFVYIEYEDSKFVFEWEMLRNAYNKFYSYKDARDMGARIMDITSAVNRFMRLYEKDLPTMCSYLKNNYLYMDNNALNILIDENEIEVRGLLKREEKQKKLQEIQEVRNNFLA